jgi:hypothetical protein
MTALDHLDVPGAGLLPASRYLEVLDAEAHSIVEAGRGAPPEARVPGAPGLTLAETQRHLGSVYRAIEGWLREGQRPAAWQRAPEPGESLEEYLLAGLEAVTGCLGEHAASTPAPSWWPEDETYGFWQRRMCHETTIHRVDVQHARGVAVSLVDDDVATDGADEALQLWFGHRARTLGLSGTRASSVLVHTSNRAWVARVGPEGTAVRRVMDRPRTDSAVSAGSMRLYFWLWGRVSIHQAEMAGDEDAIAQLWAMLRLATR